MSGLIQIGSQMGRTAASGLGTAADLETQRKIAEEQIKTQRKAQTVQTVAGGMGSGMIAGAIAGSSIAPGWGTAAGAVIGAFGGGGAGFLLDSFL